VLTPRTAVWQLFLLGAQKCSTTSLARQLHDEANVKEGHQKETQFFNHKDNFSASISALDM
jgi:hypothetical protein